MADINPLRASSARQIILIAGLIALLIFVLMIPLLWPGGGSSTVKCWSRR